MELGGQLYALATSLPRREPRTHWIGGWVGPRVNVDAMEKRKISYPRRESKLDYSVIHPVAYLLYRLSYPVAGQWMTFLINP
jgi:hypothetical protein